jgi:hypothetical protein
VASETYAEMSAHLEKVCQSCCAAGNWEAAVDTKVNHSIVALQNGLGGKSDALLGEAIALAQEHALPVRAIGLSIHRLDQKMAGDPGGAVLDEIKREFPRLVSGMVKLLLAAARRALSVEDADTASELLEQAGTFSRALSPADRCGVESELSDFHELQALRAERRSDETQAGAEYIEALTHAEQALRSAETSGGKELLANTLLRLVDLRAQLPDAAHQQKSDAALERLKSGGWDTDYVAALVLRAQRRLKLRETDKALRDIQSASAAAPTESTRKMAIQTAALIHHELKNPQAAMEAVQEAIALYQDESSRLAAQNEGQRRKAYKEEEALYLLASFLAAEANRPLDAFRFAESGRAIALRHELSLAGGNAITAPATFDETRSLIAADSAALLSFGVTRWGTLAILTDYKHPEPRLFLLELSGAELRALLEPKTGADEKAWTETLFGALPGISAKLLPKLEQVLRDLAPDCKTLYIAPDSFLYHVPFAALQFADGSYLIEHMPVAVIPSAAILAAVRSRRAVHKSRICMAYGMGESQDFYFREQADDVARLEWERCTVLPERTSKADLLAAMREYPVIHLACHGSLAAGISDPLAASQIELFPPAVLTANDILQSGEIRADLVFLNACQSGRFRMETRSDPDGFWRAFLQAGAATLITTLALIHPEAASELASAYYEAWLTGSSKARALQRAQCAMIERSAPVEDWALHTMVGDAA